MATHQNVIELNGKLYDVSSGTPVAAPSKISSTTKLKANPIPKKQASAGVALDGMVHGSASQPRLASKKSNSSRSVAHAQRKPERSQTLMRKVVKKPVIAKSHAKAAAPQVQTRPGESPARFARASNIKKNKLVSRFGTITPNADPAPISKKFTHLPVKPLPPVMTLPQKQSKAASQAKTHIPASTQQTSEQLFKKALNSADSHQQAPHTTEKHQKRGLASRLGVQRQTLNIGASLVAIVVLSGFILYQNTANINLKIASARAGFQASMPSYQPSGFSLSKSVGHEPGAVTLSFVSNSDSRNFTVTQKASSWTSEALLDNYLVAKGKQYQVNQRGGRTVYLYDGSNATWVNGGVWYRVEGNSSLNSDQLLHIADSI